MADLTELDQIFHCGADDLRRYGEAHSRERTVRRDQESIDSDHFAVSVHQWPAGVAGIDGRIGLNELPRLAAIAGRWIWTVQRADDSTSNREAKSEWVSECQDRLSRVQLSRVTPGHTGQIRRVYFNDREIGQRIGSDDLRRQNSPIPHGAVNADCPVHAEVVADDASIAQTNTSPTHAILHLRP